MIKAHSMTDSTLKTKALITIILDVIAIAFIYFVPTFSHMPSFPLYLIEPMRIMVILALVHTNRYNVLILALTLPFVSFIFSAHPHLVKTGLISAELTVNVLLFYLFVKKMPSIIAIFTSIWISKAFYYALKYLTIIYLFPNDKLISTPIYIQIITSLVFSGYVFLLFRKK
ncbi:MAG: hypothetical protein KGZ97_07085 [Bacteroidetes bacterium]|nr:hypothetical protein [Bacteroidota bacterium]